MDENKLKSVIINRRTELKMTRKDIADSLGIKPPSYHQMEKNLHKCSLSTLMKICDILDLHIQIIPKQNA